MVNSSKLGFKSTIHCVCDDYDDDYDDSDYDDDAYVWSTVPNWALKVQVIVCVCFQTTHFVIDQNINCIKPQKIFTFVFTQKELRKQ